MKNILATDNLEVLRHFARSRTVLAFDFDGTLAPIAATPEQAEMRASTRKLLARTAKVYPCAVISGRARADALRKLDGVGLFEVIGNCGVEPWQVSAGIAREVRRWRPILERRLSGLDGVTIEDKVYSLSVHYRHSPEKKKARAAIARAVASLGDVRVVAVKHAVNLQSRRAPDKGMALESLRARFGCQTAVYVGDDDTDEDVFALDQPRRLLSIRVGRSTASLAATGQWMPRAGSSQRRPRSWSGE